MAAKSWGTGAFIDQMATLLNVPIEEFDALAAKHEQIYPIASRCGVFAKSDIQPLLNQGGTKRGSGCKCFTGGCFANRFRAGAEKSKARLSFWAVPFSFQRTGAPVCERLKAR